MLKNNDNGLSAILFFIFFYYFNSFCAQRESYRTHYIQLIECDRLKRYFQTRSNLKTARCTCTCKRHIRANYYLLCHQPETIKRGNKYNNRI